jgi:hypothetical protein
MTIWVAVRVRVVKGVNPGTEIQGVALANAGYAAEEPEITIPLSLARKLGIWPYLRDESTLVKGTAFGGMEVEAYLIRKCLDVEVITQDRSMGPVRSDVLISEGERRVLLSDQLISRLKLVLVDVGAGIWRFRDDPSTKERVSATPEYW